MNKGKQMKKILIATAVIALSGAAYAGSVYSPSKGVICEKKERSVPTLTAFLLR